MAKECFCGCGRRVRFTDRGLNRQGRGTTKLVEKMRITRALVEERGPLGEDGDVAPLLKSFDSKIADGERYAAAWVEVLHDETTVSASEAMNFKREWLRWYKAAAAMDDFANLEPQEQIDVVNLSRERGEGPWAEDA